MAKTTDYKGREIIISISKPDQDAADPAGDRTGKGMQTAGQRPPGVFRRRRVSLEGFEIFDLAYRLEGGVWIDAAYRFGITTADGGLATSTITINSPGLAEYEALADEIFSVDLSAWPDTFKKLTTPLMRSPAYSVRFGSPENFIYAPDGGSEFDQNQMRAPESVLNEENIFLNVSPAELGSTAEFFATEIQLTGDGAIKFTAARDYDDPAVDYEPANGDKLFLLPALAYRSAEFVASFGGTRIERWFDDFRAVERGRIIEPDSDQYLTPLRETYAAGSGSWSGAFRVLDWLREIQDEPEAWRQVSFFLGWINTAWPPDDIPDPAYWPREAPGPYSASATAGWSEPPSVPTGGRLVIVIQQGEDWFYGWE